MSVQPTTPPTEQLRKIIAELAPSWSGMAVDGFDFLTWGFSNQNFRFAYGSDQYVLRVPGEPHAYIDRHLEWQFYRENQSIRTAELVAFDVHTGNMISRWVRAPLLADTPSAPASLVAYLRSLQDALPACSRRYDPLELSREYLTVGKPHAEVLAAVDAASWAPELPTTCHNDLNPWNILRDDDRGWVTLDWEWYGVNDPLFDLVTLHQGLGLDMDSLTALAEEFAEEPKQEKRLTNCLTAFWVREYAWAHAELHKGSRREEIETQRDTALEKIRSL